MDLLNRGDRIQVTDIDGEDSNVYIVTHNPVVCPETDRYELIDVIDEQTSESLVLKDIPFDNVERLTRTDYLTIEMSDGRVWAIPTTFIALNRASHYADEYDGDVTQSMEEDTLPLFRVDDYEVRDWASGNMNWDDVKKMAFVIARNSQYDYHSDWVRRQKTVVSAEDVVGDTQQGGGGGNDGAS